MMIQVLKKPSTYQSIDYDGLWKKLIHELFEDFVQFFLPELHQDTDFTHKPEFLQQELFQDILEKKKGKIVADQVVKVFLKNGYERWLLIHIEIQGDSDPHFAKRMFRYYYRIFDRHDKDIVAIALFTDDTKSFRSSFERNVYGTKLNYEYTIYKSSDPSEEDLLQSNNPFAFAILAVQYANSSKKDDEMRYQFKQKLIRLILRSDLHHQDRRIYISALIHFIDYLLRLPKDLTKKLRQDFTFTRGELEMFYLDPNNLPPSFGELLEKAEVEGIAKGVKKGILEGIEKGIRKGKAEGKAEGITEGQRLVAIELLKDGLELERIVKYTKLTFEEVEEIAKGYKRLN